MHPLLIILLQQVTAGLPMTIVQARELIPLIQTQFLDILAVSCLATAHAEKKPFLCGIINAKSGRCSENCAFCAQSAHYNTDSPVYGFVKKDMLEARAENLRASGANYMGIVFSGAAPSSRDFERLCKDASNIKQKTGILLCASLGLLEAEQARMLKEAGFTSYHHNLETAPDFYPHICTTHGIEGRIKTVRHALNAGLRVCSGGLFGLGESWEDRLQFSATLQELDVDSIPVNFLTPIEGTPLGRSSLLDPQTALAILAVLRLMHPKRDILVCGGRKNTLAQWENMIFSAGANGMMIGDYLTTKGSEANSDAKMLSVLGILAQKSIDKRLGLFDGKLIMPDDFDEPLPVDILASLEK